MPYHYDDCVSIGCLYDISWPDKGVEYQAHPGDFVFPADEKAEESSKIYKDYGVTGMKAGDTLSEFTDNIVSPPDGLEHYVFDGWFLDPNYSADSEVDVDTWEMPNHEVDLYAKWVPSTRQVRFNTKG